MVAVHSLKPFTMNRYLKTIQSRVGHNQNYIGPFLRRCMIRSSLCYNVNNNHSNQTFVRYNNVITKQRSPLPLRRRRQHIRLMKNEGIPSFIHRGLDEPYGHNEESTEAYLKKASLSPWTPVPDVVARKLFDMSNAGPDDIHIDLGSGDGRVNFHAIDYYKVKRSIGIDIDEGIVAVAQERLRKRHPQPDNIEFIIADLLDPNNDRIWDLIQQATIITMFFADEGLRLFRPILENKLVGQTCKVLTCGYAMPGWNSTTSEVVLGTQIYMYDWGSSSSIDDDSDFEFFTDEYDNILNNSKEQFMKKHVEGSGKFQGSKVIDHTGKYPIRGFNPDIFFEEEMDDDDDWDLGDSSSGDDEEEKPKNK